MYKQKQSHHGMISFRNIRHPFPPGISFFSTLILSDFFELLRSLITSVLLRACRESKSKVYSHTNFQTLQTLSHTPFPDFCRHVLSTHLYTHKQEKLQVYCRNFYNFNE